MSTSSLDQEVPEQFDTHPASTAPVEPQKQKHNVLRIKEDLQQAQGGEQQKLRQPRHQNLREICKLRNYTAPFYSGSFPDYLSDMENIEFKHRAQKTVSKRPSAVDPYFFQPRDRSIDRQQPKEILCKLDPEQQEFQRQSINSYLINTVVQNWRDETQAMIFAHRKDITGLQNLKLNEPILDGHRLDSMKAGCFLIYMYEIQELVLRQARRNLKSGNDAFEPLK